MAAARAACRAPRSTALRLALANIHRPGALTPTIVLSLGLGLALLVTVIEIDGNLRKQFSAALPDKAPAFYFLDIPNDDAGSFGDFVHAAWRPSQNSRKCRCCAAASSRPTDMRAEDIKPKPDAAWALQGDRGITYASEVPAGLARGRRRMVGRRTTTARRWFRSRRKSPTDSA